MGVGPKVSEWRGNFFRFMRGSGDEESLSINAPRALDAWRAFH
jgi:hypothetical protein